MLWEFVGLRWKIVDGVDGPEEEHVVPLDGEMTPEQAEDAAGAVLDGPEFRGGGYIVPSGFFRPRS